MKRSNFLRVVLIGAVGFLGFTTVGCVPQNALATLTTTLGTAVANIATLEGNTTLATQLSADTKAASTAILNWKSGAPTTEVIQALGIVEDDLNLIPGTSEYAPLIDIAIATVQTILATIPVPTVAPTPAAPVTAKARRAVYLGHPAPNDAKQFKKEWNAVIAVNPTLGNAVIK